MNGIMKDVAYAVRALLRSPAFTLVAVLTLALGIGANTAIFSVVNGAVLRPLSYPQPERLVFITSQFPSLGFDQFWVSPPEFVEFRQHNAAFSSVGAYTVSAANLGTENPVRPVTAIVSDDLFRTLGLKPLRGRSFNTADTMPGAEDVAILSYALWKRVFGGSEAALGQVVPIDGVKTRIIGVMPPGTDVHDEKVELWQPLTLDPANPGGRGRHFLYLIGRLKDGVTLSQARADLERLLRQWPKAGGNDHIPNTTTHRLRFDPLKDDIVGNARTAAWVLQAAVGFVLLIACANLAGLLLARAESRQKEFALRASLGATTWRLLRQLLAEGVVLSVLGGLLGLWLAVFGVDALIAANPAGIPRIGEITIDATVLAFTLGVAVACGMLFGLVPLLRIARGDLHDKLKETGSRLTAAASRRRARSTLIVAEVALAVILVVGAALMVRTFWNMMRVNAGFDRSRLVTFEVVLPPAVYKPADATRTFNLMIERLRSVPGVQRAAAMSGLPPLRRVNANDTDFEDISPADVAAHRAPIENVDYWQGVSLTYAQTLGVPVIEGRNFEPTDIEGPPVVLVNQTLARAFFPGRSPIGRRLRPGNDGPWLTIVGVLGDVKQRGLAAKTGTELYLLNDQLPGAGFAYTDMNIVLRTSLGPEALAGTIQRTVRSVDPALPVVKLRTMEDVFAESVSRPKFLALLLGSFAVLALVLAAVGIYGVLSYLVSERQQEIGVRMALGAERRTVLAMILRQGLVLTLVGLVLGVAGALALTRVLQSLLFGVQPTDPAAFVAGVVCISALGLLACFVPARRATRVDPMVVLRAE